MSPDQRAIEPGAPVITIAAAVITDAAGRLLVVRKAGTSCFMQPGGKIETGEEPVTALIRELEEEVGISVTGSALTYLGSFAAPAANEPGHFVVAELFSMTCADEPRLAAEIEELAWIEKAGGPQLQLAPLTERVVLPMARQQGWRARQDSNLRPRA